MNAPAKKPKAAETVEDVLTAMDERRAENLRIWNALGKTDPRHTKQFSRAGGFKGTAIKPIWITQRLTEQFGPCGVGWGMGEPQFQVVPAGDEVLVYCTVAGWYDVDPATNKVAQVYGVGGDKILTKRNDGKLFHDDEAFKKAFTDALGNAFKFVGVGADVHMGLFEDSKYLAEVTAEFHPKHDNPTTGEDPPKKRVQLEGTYKSATALKTACHEFVKTLEKMGDMGELIAWENTPDYADFVGQCQRDAPHYWFGSDTMPAEFVPLAIRVANKRRELEELEGIRA